MCIKVDDIIQSKDKDVTQYNRYTSIINSKVDKNTGFNTFIRHEFGTSLSFVIRTGSTGIVIRCSDIRVIHQENQMLHCLELNINTDIDLSKIKVDKEQRDRPIDIIIDIDKYNNILEVSKLDLVYNNLSCVDAQEAKQIISRYRLEEMGVIIIKDYLE